ncbi:HRSL1 enzyme, partial [Daphoenositta chrysoptera]|nr:HRSL1 enzyme [Daphoenositta chrysoptera]
PEPGDLIEISRNLYQHWALYVGDGYVINVIASDKGGSALLAAKARVKKQLLEEAAEGDKWRVNNKYDRSRTPFPVEEIIRRAESWVDKEVPYSLFRNNCEHFVTKLRYGEGVSDQVS